MTSEDIKKILSDLKAGEQKNSPLCIFDLDSTLYNVSPRTEAILKDFCKTPVAQKKFPSEVTKLLRINILPQDWGFSEALERENFHGSIVFFKELNHFWRKHFFSNQYMSYDTLYDGAVRFVSEIHKTNFTICYLTGRNQELMLDGSLANLNRDNFPTGQESPLIMKKDKKLNDQFFKSGMIQQLKKQHDYILYFENEPTIINQVAKDHPQVKMYFIDSTHSRKESVQAKLPTIYQDFTPLLTSE